jgi:2-methylisocitrate lyase-like PEP mutase family enzyme
MSLTHADKAKQFRALHEEPEAFVVANVWDGGSARMMAAIGFKALATIPIPRYSSSAERPNGSRPRLRRRARCRFRSR